MTRIELPAFWCGDVAPMPSAADWERLLSQARLARVADRLAQRALDRGWLDGWPPGPAQHLRNALKSAHRKRDEVAWEVLQLQRTLATAGTPVVLLKGAAYAAAGLPPGRSRNFGDIDILVHRDALRPAEDALLAAGWIPQQLDPYDERFYRDMSHELPPMQHVVRRTHLDVHHAITPPTSRHAVDTTLLLEDIRPVPGHDGIYVLGPADMVLHGVVHLLQDGDLSSGMRDLLDFAELVTHFGADSAFWPRLVQRAGQLGLSALLHEAVVQARLIYGSPDVPQDSLAGLARSGAGAWHRALVRPMITTALRPDHPDCDRWSTGLARRLIYLRSHLLRMPALQIGAHLARKAWMRARSRHHLSREPRAQAHDPRLPPP